jgi:hypothetical protein
MVNSPEIAGIQPLGQVTPIDLYTKLSNALQSNLLLGLPLIKGQDYQGQILSRADANNFYVKIQDSVYKMDLGSLSKFIPASTISTSSNTLTTPVSPSINASIANSVIPDKELVSILGSHPHQAEINSIILRYIGDTPAPKFMLLMQNPAADRTEAHFSQAGQLINQQLQEADKHGVSSRYIASEVVTRTPALPTVMAEQLKNILSKSGLFYESHLQQFVSGQRSLESIQLESQNQGGLPSVALAHQLNIIENNQLAWRGEIWPGQFMDMDIDLPAPDDQQSGNSENEDNRQAGAISTRITLHLPELGTVMARLTLIDQRVTVNIEAQDAQTVALLKSQSMELAQAFKSNGQTIDSLLVSSDDRTA